MPTFQKPCDQYQGYNFKKDVQTPVGYITALKIGTTALAVDQTVKDPLKPADDLKVVAVLTGALWELGPTDALYFSGQVSITNKQNIQLLTYTEMTQVEVICKFAVYDYDPVQKAYYQCMLGTGDAELKGIIEKNGDDLNVGIADEKSPEVQSPENYAFQIGFKPQPTAQQITIATSFSNKAVKAWGITVA